MERLEFWLAHPLLANLSCAECQRKFYLPGGKPKLGPDGEVMDRPITCPPECSICPRKSPANEKTLSMSHRDMDAYGAYMEAQAGVAPEEWKDDEWYRERMAICHVVSSNFRENKQEYGQQQLVSAVLLRSIGNKDERRQRR